VIPRYKLWTYFQRRGSFTLPVLVAWTPQTFNQALQANGSAAPCYRDDSVAKSVTGFLSLSGRLFGIQFELKRVIQSLRGSCL